MTGRIYFLLLQPEADACQLLPLTSPPSDTTLLFYPLLLLLLLLLALALTRGGPVQGHGEKRRVRSGPAHEY